MPFKVNFPVYFQIKRFLNRYYEKYRKGVSKKATIIFFFKNKPADN